MAVGPAAKTVVGRQPGPQLADIVGAAGVDRHSDRRGWGCHNRLEPHSADTCFVIGPKAVRTSAVRVVGGIRWARVPDGMWLAAWHRDDRFGGHQRSGDTPGVQRMVASGRDSC